jgi:flagellar protein FlaJ
MRYIERKNKLAVFGASIILGLSILSLVFIDELYFPELPYIIPLTQTANNMIAVAILVAILPVSIIEYNNNRWMREVDKHVPRLLMDITESIRSGLSLFNALEVAAKREYGPISEPLEAAVVNLRLTADFDGSMKMLGERLKRPSAKRFVTILMETYETGGQIIDILETSIEMFTHIAEYREERDTQIGPYILLVYIGAVIFLIISWTIITQFVVPVMEVSQQEHVAQSNILGNILALEYYRSILFWASLIEGIISGLVAGKIVHGKIGGGLIHSVILVIITLAYFNLIGV